MSSVTRRSHSLECSLISTECPERKSHWLGPGAPAKPEATHLWGKLPAKQVLCSRLLRPVAESTSHQKRDGQDAISSIGIALFNQRKVHSGIEAGSVSDYEAGAYFLQRQRRRGNYHSIAN